MHENKFMWPAESCLRLARLSYAIAQAHSLGDDVEQTLEKTTELAERLHCIAVQVWSLDAGLLSLKRPWRDMRGPDLPNVQIAYEASEAAADHTEAVERLCVAVRTVEAIVDRAMLVESDAIYGDDDAPGEAQNEVLVNSVEIWQYAEVAEDQLEVAEVATAFALISMRKFVTEYKINSPAGPPPARRNEQPTAESLAHHKELIATLRGALDAGLKAPGPGIAPSPSAQLGLEAFGVGPAGPTPERPASRRRGRR